MTVEGNVCTNSMTLGLTYNLIAALCIYLCKSSVCWFIFIVYAKCLLPHWRTYKSFKGLLHRKKRSNMGGVLRWRLYFLLCLNSIILDLHGNVCDSSLDMWYGRPELQRHTWEHFQVILHRSPVQFIGICLFMHHFVIYSENVSNDWWNFFGSLLLFVAKTTNKSEIHSTNTV